MSKLAKSYAVCDHWFCSVPSETLPNRAFMHMATSEGNLYDEMHSYSSPSIFMNLANNGNTWGIYGNNGKPLTVAFCEDIPSAVKYENHKKVYTSLPKGCQVGSFKDFQTALNFNPAFVRAQEALDRLK